MPDHDPRREELDRVLRRNGVTGPVHLNTYNPDVLTQPNAGSVRRLPRPLWWLAGLLVVVMLVVPVAGALIARLGS